MGAPSLPLWGDVVYGWQYPNCWISDTCHCGKILDNQAKPAIIGGQEADVNGIPWLVSVRVYGDVNYTCGGTIIGPLTILTAAHCLFDPIPNPNEVKVEVAKHDFYSSSEDTQ